MDQKNAAFLKKGGTQKLLLFFINELFSNSLLASVCFDNGLLAMHT